MFFVLILRVQGGSVSTNQLLILFFLLTQHNPLIFPSYFTQENSFLENAVCHGKVSYINVQRIISKYCMGMIVK